jgi:hypothetical protein
MIREYFGSPREISNMIIDFFLALEREGVFDQIAEILRLES